MDYELTRIVAFKTQKDMIDSIAHASESMPLSAFFAEFVEFVKTQKLDEIERLVTEGGLAEKFPLYDVPEQPLRRWDAVQELDSESLTNERYERFLKGEGS
ncbi:MAG: hypothetical protein WAO95_19175 [Burkholderiales bacterium]